jgi:hypothetical protein
MTIGFNYDIDCHLQNKKLTKNKFNVEINITIFIMILLRTCGMCKAITKNNE